jgi:hypothetical protein
MSFMCLRALSTAVQGMVAPASMAAARVAAAVVLPQRQLGMRAGVWPAAVCGPAAAGRPTVAFSQSAWLSASAGTEGRDATEDGSADEDAVYVDGAPVEAAKGAHTKQGRGTCARNQQRCWVRARACASVYACGPISELTCLGRSFMSLHGPDHAHAPYARAHAPRTLQSNVLTPVGWGGLR